MREYLAKRLLLFLPTLFLASLAIFAAMRIIPGDVADVILGGDENFETAGLSGGAAKQSPAFQAEHHLVDGWRSNCKEPLHVGLSRRASIDLRIGVNERQILSLSFGEPHGWTRRDRHGTPSMIDCLHRTDGDSDEHTIHR